MLQIFRVGIFSTPIPQHGRPMVGFMLADGTGGFACLQRVVKRRSGDDDNGIQPLSYIYDQVIEQQTLYAAAVYGSGAGGAGVLRS